MNEIQWLNDSEIGIDIWRKKYQYAGETLEQWLDRVSGGDKNVADLIRARKFLFGGRILSNRGISAKTTLSNCYVVEPPADNIESIYDCAAKLARTFSYGGGCGVDIGKLRPNGAAVNNSAKETSGAVSFMDLYNLTTEIIGQNGRRGALMISIPCDHPDVEQFIGIKSDLNKVTKANISVRITEEFMKAVRGKAQFNLHFEVESTGEVIEKTVDAYDLFYKLCEMNWDYAEPGILFWDRIEDWNLLSETPNFKFAGTNPCAEEPLPAGGSCLLGALNLAEFITQEQKFDFDAFRQAVNVAVYALNEVLDEGLSLHPLQEQRDSVRDWRQIGLGIMGLADMLIKMGLKYGSVRSIEVCNQIASEMARSAFTASVELGERYGSFPMFRKENIVNTGFYQENLCGIEFDALRNSQLLTIAPTGSISTMLGVSGGIEPIYANSYTRKTESLCGEDKNYKVFTPIVKAYMEEHGLDGDDSKLPSYFITASELKYRDRIDMQAVWQQYIDASISSTVNVPEAFTKEDVVDLYSYAYDKGLKGVTIYRNGCKRSGVLSTSEQSNMPVLERGEVIHPDSNIIGRKRTLQTGCGTLHFTAFFDDNTGDLMETYLSKGSTGGCNNFMIGLSRMISLAARGGIRTEDIVDQLRSCGACPSYAVRGAKYKDTSVGSSCPVAIGNALSEMCNIKAVEPESTNAPVTVCPACKQTSFVVEGGCGICKSCGYTSCS